MPIPAKYFVVLPKNFHETPVCELIYALFFFLFVPLSVFTHVLSTFYSSVKASQLLYDISSAAGVLRCLIYQ